MTITFRRISFIFAICTSAYLLGRTVVASPVVVWANQFGTTSDEEGSGVALDGLGHLYSVGTTGGVLGASNFGGFDAFFSKRDLNGGLIWTRQIGTGALDAAVNISSDATGNVYLVGRTAGSLGGPNAGGLDGFIAKYDGNGSPIWTKQFGTAADDFASSLWTDGLGNAYITGRTTGNLAAPNAGSSDVFVTKFDPNGNQSWTRQFGTSTLDESFGVTGDALGNIFVVGDTEGSLDRVNAGSRDIFLRKYDTAGALIWRNQIGTTLWDRSFEAAADGLGNVYFTGWTRGNLPGPNSGQYDGIVQKFDSDGNVIWRRQLGTSEYEYSFGISLDAAGDVYVTGSQSALTAQSQEGIAFVAKYNSNGDFQWNLPLNSADGLEVGYDVVGGEAGTAYVIGTTSGSLFGNIAGADDAFVLKVSEVPEPASLILLLTAALSAACRRTGRCRT